MTTKPQKGPGGGAAPAGGRGAFDIFVPTADPFTPLARMHERCPVTFVGGGAAVVTGAAQVRAVFRDGEVFRNDGRPPPEGRAPNLAHLDGPEHHRLRTFISKAFTPRAVARVEGPAGRFAHGLVDAFCEAGSTDLCAEFASLLPAMVIAELVGIPPGDRRRFMRWADDAIQYGLGGSSAPSEPELYDYLMACIEARRRSPGDDLLSGLALAQEGADRLSDAELYAMVRLLILAGTDTTANLIGSMLHFLLAEPSRWARALADRSLLPNVIEETLRCEPPLYWVPRTVGRDAEIAGVRLPAGTMVANAIAHANRDPETTADPDAFDMSRPASSNRSHFSFGFGAHFCVGAPLARLEGAVALRTLLDRLPDVRLSGDYEFFPHGPIMMRGVRAMPVEFTPSPRRGG